MVRTASPKDASGAGSKVSVTAGYCPARVSVNTAGRMSTRATLDKGTGRPPVPAT